eukprot:scaffold4532_cov41-Prasinocladus_malaysianus.AAC.1
MNHLLKAPFCVHPKTGKVCVPIDPETAWEFDPMSVPTVSQLLEELNQSDSDAPKVIIQVIHLAICPFREGK